MLRRIQQEMAELQAINETLEQRVSERSATAEQRAQALARSEEELMRLNETLEQRVAERSAAAEQRAQELARSEQALQQQLARINLLNQITRAIGQRQDLESLFRVILHYVEDHLPIDFDAVYFCESSDSALTTIACGPRSQRAAALGIAERSVLDIEQIGLRPCMEGDTVHLTDAGRSEAPLMQKLAQRGFHSILAVPLIVNEKPFGIMMVGQRKTGGFSDTEIEFLSMLSEHVSLATNHARLHTDLQQVYNELRQTKNAVMQQERLRALGQMASGIAHDVNNTLSAVVGYSDLLLATEPNLSPRTRQYLKSIHLAGEDVTHIVARMREFYRQRAEQDALAPVR